MSESLLDVKTLANVLGVSPRTIWNMRDAGRVPEPVKVGRLCRWPSSRIDDWIRAGCPATPKIGSD